MRTWLLIAALAIPMLSQAQKNKKGPSSYNLIVGTYTKKGSEGMYVYRFYPESGRLAYLNSTTGVSNPSYLTVSSNNKFVYATNENDNGEVSAFSFEPKGGRLQFINKQPSLGGSPCYITEDQERKHVIVANYSGGNAVVLPVNADGSLGRVSQNMQDQGKGINAERQEKPHVHTTVLSPDEKYLIYSDLGTDRLNVMHYRATQPQPLSPATPAYISLTPGSGPRHIAFTPDKKHLYAVAELGATIIAFDYNNGKLKQLQSMSLLRDGFTGNGAGAADVHVSPDGRFVYATNRGDANEIIVYAIAPETGMLTFVERKSSMGKAPRNFAIDPTGKFLVVSNQDSDSIFVYKIDTETGKLTYTNNHIEVSMPVCLKFASAE
ncbi:lactonase family protein [Mucilaginibacter sp.]